MEIDQRAIVKGESHGTGPGVLGTSHDGPGVLGESDSLIGVIGAGHDIAGVLGVVYGSVPNQPVTAIEAVALVEPGGAPPANGFGVRIPLAAQMADGQQVTLATLEAVVDDVVAQKATFNIKVKDSVGDKLVASFSAGSVSQSRTPAWMVVPITNAQVVALGAVLTGDIAIATLPAGTHVHRAMVKVAAAAVGLTTLTIALGKTAATYLDFVVASNAMAAAVYGDAKAEMGTALDDVDGSYCTVNTDIKVHLIGTDAVKKLADVTLFAAEVALLISKPF